MSGGLVKQSEVVVRLAEPIIQLIILTARKDAPSSNPHEAILPWLERTFDQAAEPKKLRELRGKLATKLMHEPRIAIRSTAIIEINFLLLAPGQAFGGRKKAHRGRFGLTRFVQNFSA